MCIDAISPEYRSARLVQITAELHALHAYLCSLRVSILMARVRARHGVARVKYMNDSHVELVLLWASLLHQSKPSAKNAALPWSLLGNS
jgi:hypothetical protein